MPWSEERLHRWILALRASEPERPVVAGSRGHDAAVLRRWPGRTVVCADQTVEGVHYEAGTAAEAVGRKAVDRVLSDLAATAARPRALVLALSAPVVASEGTLRGVVRGVWRRAKAFGAELVGGDLCAAPGPLAASVTGLGELPGRGKPPGRDRARPGQAVVVSGPVGGSLLGRHLAIEPRVREGRWLHERGASAMMDTTDGFGRDLARLAAASGVRIDLEEVPVHPDAERIARRDGGSALEHALEDGEDYELVATLGPAALARVLREAPRRCATLRRVGTVRAGRGLFVRRGGRWVRWRGGGFVHGGA